MPAAKLPAPLPLDVNRTVRQPEVLKDVGETNRPVSSLPVYRPRKVAFVLFPSQISIRSRSFTVPSKLKLKTNQFNDITDCDVFEQIVVVKDSLWPYSAAALPVSSSTPEQVVMEGVEMLNCCAFNGCISKNTQIATQIPLVINGYVTISWSWSACSVPPISLRGGSNIPVALVIDVEGPDPIWPTAL